MLSELLWSGVTCLVTILVCWLYWSRSDKRFALTARREEAMRTLRWAAEQATSGRTDAKRLGIAAITVLEKHGGLTAEDQAFATALLEQVLRPATNAWRRASNSKEVQIVKVDRLQQSAARLKLEIEALSARDRNLYTRIAEARESTPPGETGTFHEDEQ